MTPDQQKFRSRLIDLDREWRDFFTLLDIAETGAGHSCATTDIPARERQPIAITVALWLETIAIPGRALR